ncbi:cytochrome C oxidase copper chaperone [Calocera viscosa TUFC12733]|uniref:Cytochrome C oxidase copper chaperone n=1 Tax=Calocera viscosa (strain TUFC12733) TaxID=1330018 RepID=A0A167KZQ4_CALVF|nr:cytochrome C oxidase copper chaperone [Calocera viscosa TUFC12733]
MSSMTVANPPKGETAKLTNPLNPEGLKPCCACPETKSARDMCFLQHDSGEASDACKNLVQAHITCMRGYGFNI